MRNQGQVILGGFLIILGVMFLISNVFNIDLGAFCWPVGFILLGVWLLVRPQMLGPDTAVTQRLFGDIVREGTWSVSDEEFWTFIADIDLDLTKADIPLGETHIRMLGFIGDIELLVPEEIGVAVSSTAFVSDVKFAGQKEESFLMPVHLQSDNYKTAERKVRLETTLFIGDIKVRRV